MQSIPHISVKISESVKYKEIRNVTFIENLAHFIADTAGKLISVRNISNTMTSQGTFPYHQFVTPSTDAISPRSDTLFVWFGGEPNRSKYDIANEKNYHIRHGIGELYWWSLRPKLRRESTE